MPRTVERNVGHASDFDAEGAREAADAASMAAEFERLAGIRDEVAELVASLRSGEAGEAEDAAAIEGRIDLTPLPADRDDYPKRFYSPTYLWLKIHQSGSAYPIRFVNGEVVVYEPEVEEMVRSVLARTYGEVMTDDMAKRRSCRGGCGFSTFSSAAWIAHVERGPHVYQR